MTPFFNPLRTFIVLAVLLLSVATLRGSTVTLVPPGATWKYLDTGSDQGIAWREPAFDDAAWLAGPAQLGYGDGGEATVVSYGSDVNKKHVTTFFRRAFNVNDAAAFTSLSLRVLRDDGVVVYLNGIEVYRNNMPSGAVSYTTLASVAIGGADESTFLQTSINPALLVAGANVLAVEIHQSGVTSSDLSFDLELGGEVPSIQITLNSPAHGSTGVGLSPALDVSVSHRDGLPLTVTFYGRPVPPVGPDFTIIPVPDTQFYTSGLNGGSPATFNAQVDWIVANKAARNVVFVTQLGDCVQNGDNGGNDVEWRNATNALYRLENPVTTFLDYGIPYGVAVGNHDQSPVGSATGTSTFYNQYFGESHFSGRPYYGGHYSTNNDDHFELFSASGLNFIAIHFEYDTAMTTNSPELTWANDLLQTYSDRQAIVISHWIMNSGDSGSFSAQGQAIYNRLKVNPNLFLMLCGHVNPNGEGKRIDVFNGQTVHTVLSDYQDRANGGNGWLRIMEFSPSNSVIRVQTYSPTLSQFETDASSQFNLYYDMRSLVGDPFAALAVSQNVPSGGSAVALWANRALNTDYEWYVAVSDGVETITSSIWQFRTAGQTLPLAPDALVATAQSSSEILLTWRDHASNEAGFEIQQSLDGVSYSTVGTLGVDATSARVTGLQSSTTYSYRVRAFNDAGYSADSNIGSARTLAPPPPPIAPSDFTVVAVSTSELTLNWTDRAGNEDGFRIERSTDGVNFIEIGVVTANVSAYSDTGLRAGTTYHYRVRAYNIAGVSDYSNVSSAATQPIPPPPAPAGLVALAQERSVALTWNESSGVQRYYVYRSETSGGPYAMVAQEIATTNWTDTGLTPHTPYFYVVTARNAGGESPYSNEAGETPYTLPAIPSNATITRSETDALEITWMDNALDETGYRVERSLDNINFNVVINLPGDTAFYRDEILADNTTYYYRIRAFNSDGQSAPAEVSGTTLTLPPNPPSNLSAAAVSSSQINLSWADNANDETAFEIERKSGSGGPWGLIAVVAANSTSYGNARLAANTTYYYRVRAANAGGYSGYSGEASAVTLPPTTVTFFSTAVEDGYITESSETSNVGGPTTGNSTGTSGLRAGDNNQDRQIKSVVSFNTSALPDGAHIISATLRLRRGTISGANPFTTHGACLVDITGATGFAGSTTLASGDFQAAGNAAQVATLSNAANNGDWSAGSLNAAGLSFINKVGTTQCRIYFQADDNDDGGNDYIGWYAGDTSTSANRPQLVIVYE